MIGYGFEFEIIDSPVMAAKKNVQPNKKNEGRMVMIE